MINHYTTPLSTKGNIEKFVSSKTICSFYQKFFYQDFTQFDLKKNTKTITLN